jgi:hypothetical protein
MFSDNYVRNTVLHYAQLTIANMPYIYMHFLIFFVLWTVCRYIFLDDFFLVSKCKCQIFLWLYFYHAGVDVVGESLFPPHFIGIGSYL